MLLKGCIVTIDALGCRKAIAARIIRQEADYVLMAKNNQPGLAAAIDGFFSEAERIDYREIRHTRAEWIEKDHGRIETRRCVATDDLSCLKGRQDWPDLKRLAMVEAMREIHGVTGTERRYYFATVRRAKILTDASNDITAAHRPAESD